MRVVQMNATLMSAFDFTLRVESRETGGLVKATHGCVSLCTTYKPWCVALSKQQRLLQLLEMYP